jgi:hypothetical protein
MPASVDMNLRMMFLPRAITLVNDSQGTPDFSVIPVVQGRTTISQTQGSEK